MLINIPQSLEPCAIFQIAVSKYMYTSSSIFAVNIGECMYSTAVPSLAEVGQIRKLSCAQLWWIMHPEFITRCFHGVHDDTNQHGPPGSQQADPGPSPKGACLSCHFSGQQKELLLKWLHTTCCKEITPSQTLG